MRKILYYLQLYILFSIVFIILFESTRPIILVSAPIIAIISIYISEKFFLKNSYFELYEFNLLLLIRYLFLLLIEIYKSSIAMLPIIISGKAHPVVISFNTEIEEPLYIAMISNSITLTPGTITIDVSGHRLLVLWLNPSTKESTMAGKIIKGKFEDCIKRWRL